MTDYSPVSHWHNIRLSHFGGSLATTALALYLLFQVESFYLVANYQSLAQEINEIRAAGIRNADMGLEMMCVNSTRLNEHTGRFFQRSKDMVFGGNLIYGLCFVLFFAWHAFFNMNGCLNRLTRWTKNWVFFGCLGLVCSGIVLIVLSAIRFGANDLYEAGIYLTVGLNVSCLGFLGIVSKGSSKDRIAFQSEPNAKKTTSLVMNQYRANLAASVLEAKNATEQFAKQVTAIHTADLSLTVDDTHPVPIPTMSESAVAHLEHSSDHKASDSRTLSTDFDRTGQNCDHKSDLETAVPQAPHTPPLKPL